MRHRTAALAATTAVGLAAGLFSAVPPGHAQTDDVVFTSGFEDGTVEGWTSRGGVELEASTAQAHSGEYSLLTTGRDAAWKGPAHNMNDVLGAEGVYEFELSVRLADGEDDAPIAATMEFTSESSGETAYTGIASAETVTDGDWTTLTGRYTPPEPSLAMIFYVESSEATASYHIDDITVTEIEPPPEDDLPGEETAAVDFTAEHQLIEGFGFSGAFQRAAYIGGLRGLTPEHQQEVLDLLFDPENGAGFSILRNGIGSSTDYENDKMLSIQPEDPGGPDAEPQYEWDGYDGGQLWLAQAAQDYGVDRFYADAWSAPGYMKTNGDDADGGELCGVTGTDCADDWRQAYADYLVQYAQFYADEGIDITEIGFTNEPDYTTSYASMRFTPEQINDFVQVLGPTVDQSGLDMNLVCCDSFGWDQQVPYTEAIEADPDVDRWVDIHAGHSYASSSNDPLPTDETVWMSEYALAAGDEFNPAWDAGGANSGLALANHIHDTLTGAEVNAYITWFGASLNNTAAPIRLDGEEYEVAKRLYATAAYSRFVRPDAHRVEADTSGEQLKISAYTNADGSRVVDIINNRRSDLTLDLALTGAQAGETMTTHRTDEEHSLEAVGQTALEGPGAAVEIPARSLTTLVIDAPEPTDSCTAHLDVVHSWGSGWLGTVTVEAGEVDLDGWDLAWTWPGDQRVKILWGADWSQSGPEVNASDLGWNGRIRAGDGRRVLGFIATGDPAEPDIVC